MEKLSKSNLDALIQWDEPLPRTIDPHFYLYQSIKTFFEFHLIGLITKKLNKVILSTFINYLIRKQLFF